ncbi:hypothetical protein J437_LFUL007624 [Ladona fulva]|uniref:Guanylate kinase-like domain-containing protein n=1 Tax=Ladona fulva TaxID=123851 RepID=A0A8K0K5S8_LADFU|nr:hypothetical protein J437_LFUL007624 [Ladona fulva]
MYCLRSLYIQYNQIEEIGEHLDMTGNPVAKGKDLEDLVYLLHPSLKSFNGIDCSTSAKALRVKPIKMCWKNPFFRAGRQYDDLLLGTELLQKNRGSWHSPEIEYMDRLGAPYPVLLLVGPKGFWRESLCRNLCKIYSEEVYVSPICSTDDWLMKEENVYSCRYVSKEQFFSMLRSGELVSASQDGFSILGLEKRQLDEAMRKGKVLVSAVDLESALVLRGSGFGGAPRLVLVLPGKSQEEEMIEMWRRRVGKTVKGMEEWEEELRREWAESQEEYLNTHIQNPGLFEFGLIYEGDCDTLGQIKNLVLEMLHAKAKHRSFDSQEKAASYQSMGVSESVMKLIDKRLKKELNPDIEIW